MVTWTTRTAQITGPNAVWRTSPKQRKAALELAVVVVVVELEPRTRNRQLVAQMFRAMQSIASNSNGPVPIHGILGSEKTARKLATHARSFLIIVLTQRKNNNEEEERNQFDAKIVYKTFNFKSS